MRSDTKEPCFWPKGSARPQVGSGFLKGDEAGAHLDSAHRKSKHTSLEEIPGHMKSDGQGQLTGEQESRSVEETGGDEGE